MVFLFMLTAVGPKFTYAPEPIVAPLGDEVEFECSLDVPAEQIWWKHNRRKLSVVHFNATKSQLLLKVCAGYVGVIDWFNEKF